MVATVADRPNKWYVIDEYAAAIAMNRDAGRIEARLGELLGRRVDVVTEPAPARRIQRAIEQDRRVAF
jgi:predicted nucleotidyltransferase